MSYVLSTVSTGVATQQTVFRQLTIIMIACAHCGEENDIELILMADFIIDEETGRPYAMYRYRCDSCENEFDEELKWWE